MSEVKQLINLPPHHSKVYIYDGVLEQIRTMYPVSPELAGKIAIAAIETVFTEHHSFEDDPTIVVAMVPFQSLAERNNDSYDRQVEKDRDKKLVDWDLERIADMLNHGYNQAQISKELRVSESTVSRRVRSIRADYPWLLTENLAQNTENLAQNLAQKMKSCTEDEILRNFQKSHEISEISDPCMKLRDLHEISEISDLAQDIDIDIDIDIENESERFSLLDFEKKEYVNSYDDTHVTTGKEILDSYNFEDQNEIDEMHNEFPEAYEDLIKCGVIQKKWEF